MKYPFLILSVLIISSCTFKKNHKNESSAQMKPSETILRLSDDQVDLIHNFPDTLITGEKVIAEIESKNRDWQIISSFIYCPIGENDTFKVSKSTELECLELPVENHKTQIEFTTNGIGDKYFGLVTIVLENSEMMRKATELEFYYYLRPKDVLQQ